jgi:hypothetical protein
LAQSLPIVVFYHWLKDLHNFQSHPVFADLRTVKYFSLKVSRYIFREICQRLYFQKYSGRGRVQDTDGMLERKEKEHGEEREIELSPEKRVCQWRSGKIKSKKKMDECRTE